MAEIPRVYAQPNVQGYRIPRPTAESYGAGFLGTLAEEFGRQAKEEEALRLETYDIEIQTQLRQSIINARTKAAETTDPEEYQRVYESELQKGFDPLQATVGKDPKRGLILNRRYNEQVRRESDNIAAGVLDRKRALSIVNAEKIKTLAVDKTLDAPDETARLEQRVQFGLDVDRMVGLSEIERNKLKQDYLVETTAQLAVKRAQAGDALGAIKDIERGAYKDLDLHSRKAVKSEINSYLNELQQLEGRQRTTDKRVLESKIEGAILDNKPADEIRALIRQGVAQQLLGREDVSSYESRVLGRGGKDTPEQIANFNEFRARFQGQSYTARSLADAQSEARSMWKSGQLGNIGYGNLGGLFRQVENQLDIKAHRGAGEGATIRGYDQGATRIRQAFQGMDPERLRRNKDFQGAMTEYNQRVQKEDAKSVATDIYNRMAKQQQEKKQQAQKAAEAATKAEAEKAKGGVDPTTLNQIQGLAR